MGVERRTDVSPIEQNRQYLVEIVDHFAFIAMSQMVGYAQTGSIIGANSEWVRHRYKGHPGYGLNYIVGLNIRALHESLFPRRKGAEALASAKETHQANAQALAEAN